MATNVGQNSGVAPGAGKMPITVRFVLVCNLFFTAARKIEHNGPFVGSQRVVSRYRSSEFGKIAWFLFPRNAVMGAKLATEIRHQRVLISGNDCGQQKKDFMFNEEGLTQLFHNLIPIIGKAGFKVEAVEPGRVRTSMPIELNTNHLGTFYAGSLLTLAEVTGGLLFTTNLDISRYKLMVKTISIEYHRLGTTDAFVDAALPEGCMDQIEAQIQKEGKAFYELSIEVRDAEGTLVATTRLNYRLKYFSENP